MNLTTIRTALGTARNIAHDLVAIVGLAAGSAGAIATALSCFGLHVGSADVAHVALVAGLGVTVVSKGIDSLNDALKAAPVVPHG